MLLLITFLSTAALILLLIAAITLSVVNPIRRIWPPLARQTWQYYFVWVPTLLTFLGLILVGILDWNSLGLPAPFRWPLGILLVFIGNVLAWVGVAQLSLRTTSGAEGALITDGLYRHMRNPQYLGDILILFGWSVWTGSLWAIPLTLGAIFVFILTPFAEEPWLRQCHGSDYDKYRENVPRFLPRFHPQHN